MNDLISRQAAIAETWKDTGYSDPLNVMTAIRDRLEALPSAQSGCEDAVSRKAVEEMLQNGFPERGMWEVEGDIVRQTVCETLVDALMDLEKLPSVTLKQPGWIPWDKNTRNSMKYTLQTLYRLAYNIHGVMDAIDDDNVKRLIALLEGGQDE